MKKKMPQRPLEEIYRDLIKAVPGKEARKLHKELKQYGSGLFFIDRYPFLPYYFSLVVSVLAVMVAVLSMFI